MDFPIRRLLGWLGRDVLPGLLASVVVLVVIFAIGEAYFRLSRPFFSPHWPSRFDQRFGFNFEPNTEVRWTNYFDFWVKERTNSIGFLDREPAPPSARCHVAFIGDSFVEAAQVTNSDKVQVVLENLATQGRPDLKLTAAGFGYSGTGQLNQLPFYDVFARQQHPHLVVLVFVGNDFRNNSTILESIGNGWDPDHAPRVFAQRTAGGFALTEIDPDWQKHLLPAQVTMASKVNDKLRKYSAFFDWIYRKATLIYPNLFGTDEATKALKAAYRARFEILRQRERYRDIMVRWDYDGNPGALDSMFDEKELSPPFVEALAFTGFALEEFKRRVERDNGHLVVLAASQLSLKNRDGDPEYRTRQLNRLRSLAEKAGVPVIDHYDYIARQGGDPKRAQFPNDGHWSIEGHRWAAGAVWEYLQRQDKICR